MNCLKFRKLASLYLDRQLDSASNQDFLFHQNSCKECFQHVDELRKTAQLLSQFGEAMPPANLASEILARIEQQRRPGSLDIMAWLRNITLYSRPQYIAYATSFVITCLLFAG